MGEPNSFLFHTFTSHDGICSHWHIPHSHPQQFQSPQSVALQGSVFTIRSPAAALCTYTRKAKNPNPDTCRHSCDSSDGPGGPYVSADDIPQPAEIHLQRSPASTSPWGREVHLSSGPRRRYLMRIFLAVSISRRRRVFDSEEQQPLSQLF